MLLLHPIDRNLAIIQVTFYPCRAVQDFLQEHPYLDQLYEP
jgi:hypothetical protein